MIKIFTFYCQPKLFLSNNFLNFSPSSNKDLDATSIKSNRSTITNKSKSNSSENLKFDEKKSSNTSSMSSTFSFSSSSSCSSGQQQNQQNEEIIETKIVHLEPKAPSFTKETSPSICSTTSSLANHLTSNDLLTINVNCLNKNNTITNRYQHFEKRKTNNQQNINTNEEVYDFSCRINKLRFIDDSASSTALTSPAESLSHFYFGSISSMNKQQQLQHRLLNNYCSPGNNGTNGSTSSSRTVSMPPSSNCSLSNSSAASTPAMSNRSSRPSITNRLVQIQRQSNVKSSTDTICSNSDIILHHKMDHSKNECKVKSSPLSTSSPIETKCKNNCIIITTQQQFQHENLTSENYRTNKSGHQSIDGEDDEEIKSIIMNNLNDKLKASTSKQHIQRYFFNIHAKKLFFL